MKKNKSIPSWAKISFAVFILSTFVYFIAINNRYVADFINDTASVALRAVMSSVTYFLPFSLFEMLIILSPLILIILLVTLLGGKRGSRCGARTVFSLLGVISLIMTMYIFMLGIGYRTTSLSSKLGIDNPSDISPEELYQTAVIVRDEVNALSEKVDIVGVETVMPYSTDELSKKIIDAYDRMNAEYGLVYNFPSVAKPVYFSTVMSDLRITGIYSFFTGEANVNVEYPDYGLPFTVAHEFAHQRGICRENEANFTAFLVCIASDDDYIRYSGYLSLYEYLSSAVYRTDKELYYELNDGLSATAVMDIAAANAVYQAHKDSILGEINDRMNDTYLKLNGTQGNVTYGYVVRLAVGYYRDKR